jgi:hypothetical protein
MGTGFLAGQSVVLTCAHVVQEAGSGPGQVVAIRFQCNDECQTAQVDAPSWRDAAQEDLAVLLLPAPPPVEATRLRLGDSRLSPGHAFRSFGYPVVGDLTGIAASGTITERIRGEQGRPLLQLASQNIAQGSSGGPVFDDSQQALVGMVVATFRPGSDTKNRDTCFATPIETLIEAYPELVAVPAPPPVNPFFTGGAVPPERFIGRQTTLAWMRARLGGDNLQSLSITGDRRIGKSSLLHYLCERAAEICDPPPVVVYLDLMRAYCHTRAGFMRALRREITQALGREPWTAAEDADLQTLAFAFEDLHDSGVRLILCLDEIEQLTKRRDQFDEVLEELRGAGQIGYVGLVTSSARTLADLCQSHSLSSPFYNIFTQELLGLFSPLEWRPWLERAFPGIRAAELDAIDGLSGGHPFYTQVAARNLWEARHGQGEPDWAARTLADLEPYWRDTWQRLDERERDALRAAAGLPGPAPSPTLPNALQRRGLLRGGQPFSPAFGDWLRSPAFSDWLRSL